MYIELPKDQQITGFELISIRDLPTSMALDSNIPEEVIWAILSNYDKSDAVKLIKQVIRRLQKVTHDQAHLQRVIQQLLVFSRLRNLDEEVEKQLKEMPIEFDITTDRLYTAGVKQGKKQGKKRSERAFVLRLRDKGKGLEEIADLTGFSIRKIQNILASENAD